MGSRTTMRPTAIDNASRVATAHASSATPHQTWPSNKPAASPSSPKGMLKVSAVPKWPFGREKRVDFIQRTWCFSDAIRLRLITM